MPAWNDCIAQPLTTPLSSAVFEPSCEDTEDHTKIHEDYKALVDFMLGSYIEDIGIKPEEFEEACSNSSIKSGFQQVGW